ncbi:MAG TPA: transposase [bacterium]|nr:transposase [bacterium]
MQRIRDRATPYLFDEWQFLGEKRKKMLAKGWPGIVRGELLEWLPIEQGRLCFDAKQGRPTKELYTMVGVVALQQMLDLTDREVVSALAFDARWHYALDIRWESDADKYVCERTVRGYRKRMVELGLDRVIFERLTDRLLAVFEVETGGAAFGQYVDPVEHASFASGGDFCESDAAIFEDAASES